MPAWWDRLTANKRWGSTSSIEEPTDAQANQGFAFLGTVPPSAQLHDAMFQYLDDKDYWLYQQIHVVINSEGITEAFADYNSLLAALDSRYVLGPAPVLSVSGKTGVVTLVVGDVSGAAPLASPVFSGAPTTPTPATSDNSLKVPNTSWVRTLIGGIPGSPVTSVAGKTGAVSLVVGDVSGAAPLDSPAFTGTPTVPTQSVGNNSTRAASTAYVLASLPAVPVQSVAGKIGAVTLAVADVSGAAPLASPVLTGNPTAPTPAAGDADTSVATTAFVMGAKAKQMQVFTANGNFTVPAGITKIKVRCWGGGGAGGGATVAGATGSGAGGAGYSEGVFTVTPAAVHAVTIGAGGVPVANSTGGNGGSSSLGALISATGGGGGFYSGGGAQTTVGTAGSGTGGQFNIGGGGGSIGLAGTGGPGGGSFGASGGPGGTIGGGGGMAPGGGGGGGMGASGIGGTGGPGRVIVEW